MRTPKESIWVQIICSPSNRNIFALFSIVNRAKIIEFYLNAHKSFLFARKVFIHMFLLYAFFTVFMVFLMWLFLENDSRKKELSYFMVKNNQKFYRPKSSASACVIVKKSYRVVKKINIYISYHKTPNKP